MTSDLVITDMEIRGKKMRVAASFSGTALTGLDMRPCGARERIGSVYCGVIETISAGMESAYVRLGKDEHLYLPLDGRALHASDKTAVQIVREGTDRKDPQCTRDLTLSGRFAVVTLGKCGLRFSTRLKASERARLKEFAESDLADLSGPLQILFRTAAGSAASDLVADEIRALAGQVGQILDRSRTASPGQLLYEPPAFYDVLIREREEGTRLQTDIPAVAERYGVPCCKDRSVSLAQLKGLETAVERLLQKTVHLSSGGFLVIERTEAFHVIDVNTGNCTKGKNAEELFFRLNLEAAAEAARQIRLRNLSGIILIDFIDLKEADHRQALIDAMKQELRGDPRPAKAVGLTKLGIMEITRQKRENPIADYFL